MAQSTSNPSLVPEQTAARTPECLTRALIPLLPGFASVQWLDSTGSTNLDLMQRLRQPDTASGPLRRPALPWLLGADLQTAGRGRAGRPWQNAQGATLMFSCAFQVEIPMPQLAGLSPALGVAACEALRALIDQNQDRPDSATRPDAQRLTLKWPNDLQWDAGKLAGILVETHQPTGSRAPYLVAGIGLNMLDANHLSQALNRPISDWSQITDTAPARIVAAIAHAWSMALKDYAANGYTGFIERFARVDVLSGVQVDVSDQGRILQTGTAHGTDAMGRLLVATASGITPIMVGDVSIRSVSAQRTPR